MKCWKIVLPLFLLAALLLICSGCGKAEGEQPVSITIWHVYGAQTDSPLNDLIDEFNDTVGKEEGIRVEVTMVSNNKNIYEDILAAANQDPGAPELPDIFVAYPKTVLNRLRQKGGGLRGNPSPAGVLLPGGVHPGGAGRRCARFPGGRHGKRPPGGAPCGQVNGAALCEQDRL